MAVFEPHINNHGDSRCGQIVWFFTGIIYVQHADTVCAGVFKINYWIKFPDIADL